MLMDVKQSVCNEIFIWENNSLIHVTGISINTCCNLNSSRMEMEIHTCCSNRIVLFALLNT